MCLQHTRALVCTPGNEWRPICDFNCALKHCKLVRTAEEQNLLLQENHYSPRVTKNRTETRSSKYHHCNLLYISSACYLTMSMPNLSRTGSCRHGLSSWLSAYAAAQPP